MLSASPMVPDSKTPASRGQALWVPRTPKDQPAVQAHQAGHGCERMQMTLITCRGSVYVFLFTFGAYLLDLPLQGLL